MSIEKTGSAKIIENIHVGLWLVKDTSWMMEFKVLGCFMILPTLLAAIWILYLSFGTRDFWINLAVLFWIAANSTWMVVEFYALGNKMIALPFFVLGFVAFFTYLYSYYYGADERR